MLIEFSCPVCHSPLALKNKTEGGQVNCPKCHKLILLPSESTLPRHDPEVPPFQPGLTYRPEEVARAISTSVAPYRRDLESKSDLLNDAVEMVKVRNQRIKELETHNLKIQGELWALEAEVDQLRSDREAQEAEAEKARAEKAKAEEAKADEPPERVPATPPPDSTLHGLWESAVPLLHEAAATGELLRTQTQVLTEGTEGLQEAESWIKQCVARLQECATHLEKSEQARKVLEKKSADLEDEMKQYRSARDTR
jgi:hypothetical protein